MAEYINREEVFNILSYKNAPWNGYQECKKLEVTNIVRCKDCKYWKDARVKTNDGRERQYRPDDVDQNFGIPLVDISVGINIGSECVYEQGRGWMTDRTVFRNGDDFCSRGEERMMSYEEWWGIKDGYYNDKLE